MCLHVELPHDSVDIQLSPQVDSAPLCPGGPCQAGHAVHLNHSHLHQLQVDPGKVVHQVTNPKINVPHRTNDRKELVLVASGDPVLHMQSGGDDHLAHHLQISPEHEANTFPLP